MNNIRIAGLVVFLLGLMLLFFSFNDTTDFISGLSIGLGFGFLLTGKLGKSKNPKENIHLSNIKTEE